MNCPNCGAETNESVCPVCGAAVGTSGGFKLAGNDQPQQPEGVTYDAQPQQGMGMDPQYGGPQYQGDPMQNGYAGNAYGTDYQQPTKKKNSLSLDQLPWNTGFILTDFKYSGRLQLLQRCSSS